MIAFGGWRSGKSELGDKSSTVFVASSKEAIDAEWLLDALTVAEEKLGDDGVSASFELWNEAFSPGEMTAEAIMGIARTVGAAIVVLTADDETYSRGEATPAPRDNLLFEAGLFLSHLDFGRVLVLREDESKLPSDLLGVSLPSFSKPKGEERLSGVATQRLGQKICRFVSDALDNASGEESSVTRAITKSIERSEARSSEVRSAISGPARHETPIPLQDASMVYVDAVEEVQETFIATTYLDSSFWTMRQTPVIQANESLAERIEKAGGTAKRLILLTQPIEDEIRSQRERRRSLRSVQPKLVERMDKEFNALAKANKGLVRSGFDVRVAFDHDELWKLYLSGSMPFFSAGDTELALFDEDRIDIYSGFTNNGYPAAKMIGSSTHRSFKTIYDQTVEYVDDLWHSAHAEDFEVFANKLGDVISESQWELDYEPNWLLKYDADEDPGDARLKEEELKFVIQTLSAGNGYKENARHLDLGTCTGRYMEKLRERLGVEVSVGVDLDDDCLNHCKRIHRELLEDERRFRIIDADIRNSESLPGEKFDLVTCMMGTLCHLRRISERTGVFEDPWQKGLENMAERLEHNGDAFIAIWNVEDVQGPSTPSLLKIYPQRSCEILLKHSPGQEELEARLDQAGLRTVSHSLIEKRLHVYHLQHT